MAILTAARAASTAPVPGLPIPNGVLGVAWGVYSLAANPTAADIIHFCKVPAGATVIGGFLQGSDLDTNGTEELDISIGWAANGTDAVDVDGFGALSVLTGDASVHLPVAGLWLPFANIIQNPGFKTFAAETTLTATINVDAATFTAGVLKMVAWYV